MNLKQRLELHYKAFDKFQISPDPLQFLHLFSDKREIELVGFISSIFAYGNIKQIINTLNRLMAAGDNKPYNFIANSTSAQIKKKLAGIKHRFYSEEDVNLFFQILSKVYNQEGSLEKIFMQHYNQADKNLKNSINEFSKYFLNIAGKENTHGFKFMFSLPEKGSACKRMNLFLRWMIRKDELDFGLWKGIPPDKLVIPVDTHVAKICKKLKLTSINNVSWKMAEEITDNLRRFDPNDPVKYDFAICHIGMRKLEF
ncbi:MAG: TIGR02757 family protein [Ignavibacteriaceae bacterium]